MLTIIGFLLVAGSALQPQYAHAQTATSSFPVAAYATTTEGLIARYSELYGVSQETMAATIQSESRGNDKAWNRTDPYGGAKGIAQFLQPTFDTWSKRAGVYEGNVWNKEHSIHTMAYMFSQGQQRQWTCARMLGFAGVSST